MLFAHSREDRIAVERLVGTELDVKELWFWCMVSIRG